MALGLLTVSGKVAFSKRSRVCQFTSFTKSIRSAQPSEARRMYCTKSDAPFLRVTFKLTRNGPFSATSTCSPSLSTYSRGAFCSWSPCISHDGHVVDSSKSNAKRMGALNISRLPFCLSIIDDTSPLASMETL